MQLFSIHASIFKQSRENKYTNLFYLANKFLHTYRLALLQLYPEVGKYLQNPYIPSIGITNVYFNGHLQHAKITGT